MSKQVKCAHVRIVDRLVLAADSDHELVVEALKREGWTITDDPLVLPYGGKEVYVDLGAERVLGEPATS